MCKHPLILLSTSIALIFGQCNARGQAGNDNPTGPAGQFNGNVTTGSSYDPFTGNATRTISDMAVAGAVGEYGLSYSRIWNSRGTSGWRHQYSWSIRDVVDLPAGQPIPYTVSFPDGRTETFGPPTLGGAWRTGTGTRERFKPLDGSLCYLLLPDGGKVEFSATSSNWYDYESRQTYYSYDFTATAIIDPYGLRTTFTRNPDGTLSRITEPAGRWIQLFYTTISGKSVVDYIQGSDGRIVDYTYAAQTFPPGIIPHVILTSVEYYRDRSLIPPAVATYTYEKPNIGSVNGVPLLKTCNDPMYAGQ